MNDQSLYLLLGQLFTGFLLLTIAVVFYYSPPKKMNSIYGYRTSRSMINGDTWNIGNAYSAKVFLIIAILQIVIVLLVGFLIKGIWIAVLPMITLVIGVILIIILTEQHLKDNFDVNGNLKK